MTPFRTTTYTLTFKAILIATFCFFFISPILAEDQAPSVREKKTEEGYIFNLKDLIKESKSKIEKVDEKIKDQAKLRRNQQREEKAREYYEQAMRLYNEGKYEEAAELWKKAIKITENPEMKDYINESVKKSKRQEELFKSEEDHRIKRLESERGYSAEEVEKVYQSGVSLYKQKKYLAAKEDFEKVDEMFPDHKATRSYLMLIDHEIDKEQQEAIDNKVKNEAMALKKEKDAWKEDLDKKEVAQEQKTKEQAQSQYNEAVELYNNKDYDKALEKFQSVEWIIPNYKDTGKYLTKLEVYRKNKDKKLEQEEAKKRQAQEDAERAAHKAEEEKEARRKQQEDAEKNKRLTEEADFSYNAAISLYAKKLYLPAKDKFQEVEKTYPNFKSTRQYLGRIDKDISTENQRLEAERQKILDKKQKEEQLAKDKEEAEKRKQRELDEKARQEKMLQEADGLYKDGMTSYNKHQFKDAKDKFEQLQRLYPGYKSVAQHLSHIDEDIAQQEKRDAIDKQKALEDRQRQEVYEQAKKVQEEKSAQQKEEKEAKQEAKKQQESLAAQARKEAQEDKIKEREDRQKEEAARRQAESAYKEALALYKAKEFDKAKQKFNDCLMILPDYGKAKKYLSHIDEDQADYERQKQEDQDALLAKVKMQKEKDLEEKKRLEEKRLTKSQQEPETKEKEQAAIDKGQIRKEKDEALARQKELKLAEAQKRKEEEDQKRQLKEKLKTTYEDGVDFFEAKNYEEAKGKFDEVLQMDSSYRPAQKYLTKIEQRLAAQERDRNKQETPKQTVARPQKTQKQQVASVSSGDDTVRRAEEERNKRISKEAEEKYNQAVSLFRSKRYLEAKAEFINVEMVSPGYKASLNYLGQIDEAMAKQDVSAQPLRQPKKKSTDTNKVIVETSDQPTTPENPQAETMYQEALKLYQNKQFVVAKEKLDELNNSFPNYKDAPTLLQKTQETIASEVKAMALPPLSVESKEQPPQDYEKSVCMETEKDFKEAMEHYKAGRLVEAKSILLHINTRTPCQKEVKKYLVIIDKKLRQQAKQKYEEIAKARKQKIGSEYQAASADNYEWQNGRHKEDVLLKLKREQLKTLEGERYKSLKEQIDQEELIKKQVLRDRKIDDALRRKSIRRRVRMEAQAQKEKDEHLAEQEKQAQLDAEKKLKEEELAKQKEDDRKTAEERAQKIKDDQQKKQEEIAKKKEDERLAREERKRQIEEEKRRRAEELAKKKEEERKAAEERAQKLAEEKRQKEEALAKQKEDERQAREDKLKQEQAEKEKQQQEIAKVKEERAKKALEEKTIAFGETATPEDKVLAQYEYEKDKEELKNQDAGKHLDQIRNRKRQLKAKLLQDMASQRARIDKLKQREKITEQTRHIEHVEKIYQEAVALYRDRRFVAAKTKFSMVENIWPGYKMAAAYIKLSEERIADEEKRAAEEKAKQDKLEAEKKKKEEQEQALQKQKEEKQQALQKQKEEKQQALQKQKEEKEQAQQKLVEEKKKAKEDQDKQRADVLAKKQAFKDQKKKEHDEQLAAKEKAKEEAKQKKGEDQQKLAEEKQKAKLEEEHQKELSKKEQFLEDTRAKAKEERLSRAEEQEKLSQQKAKEEEALKAKKDKEDAKMMAAQTKKAQKEINSQYQELQALIKQKNYALAEDRINHLQSALGEKSLPGDFVGQMSARIERDKARIQDDKIKDKQKQDQIASKREEEFNKAKQERTIKDQQTLTQMAKNIQSQEEQLAKERKMLDERLERQKQREEDRKNQEKMAEEQKDRRENLRKAQLASEENASKENVSTVKVDETAVNQLQDEKRKQQELNRLAKEKEAQLKREREKVEKELDQRLSELYNRATRLMKQGSLPEAKRILVEIDTMKPSYQKTRELLRQIDQKEFSPPPVKTSKVKIEPQPKPKPTKMVAETRQDIINNALDKVEGSL